MKERSGYLHLPTALLTISLLALVLAVGFVIGRVVVAGAYRDAAPEFERLPDPEPGEAPEVEQEAARAPGKVHVPPPAEVPPEPIEEASAGGAGGIPSARGPTSAPPDISVTVGRPPRPEPTPEAPEPAEASGGQYTIQVGLFTTAEGARQVAESLTRAGHPARIVVERGEGATLYRVLTGQYHTEYAARNAITQLRQEGFPAFLLDE